MNHLTQRQLEYQAYLLTDHWKNKRLAVLEQRGCTCEKCKEWGNEIHHLSYENLWNEPLTDLVVLCRDCHEATHRALNSIAPRNRYKKNNVITRRAMLKALSRKQKEKLKNEFRVTDVQLECKILCSNKLEDYKLLEKATKFVGFDDFKPRTGKISHKKIKSHILKIKKRIAKRKNLSK